MEQKRRPWGRVGQSAVTAGKLIPVFGQFIGAGDELYQIWYGDPKAEETLRTDVLHRAAELTNAYHGDVEARFEDIGGQLTAQLNMLEDLAKRGATTPPLAAAYYAELPNESQWVYMPCKTRIDTSVRRAADILQPALHRLDERHAVTDRCLEAKYVLAIPSLNLPRALEAATC